MSLPGYHHPSGYQHIAWGGLSIGKSAYRYLGSHQHLSSEPPSPKEVKHQLDDMEEFKGLGVGALLRKDVQTRQGPGFILQIVK